jgi:hypothetical protein
MVLPNAMLDGSNSQVCESENWMRATYEAQRLIIAAHPKVIAIRNELLKVLSNESGSKGDYVVVSVLRLRQRACFTLGVSRRTNSNLVPGSPRTPCPNVNLGKSGATGELAAVFQSEAGFVAGSPCTPFHGEALTFNIGLERFRNLGARSSRVVFHGG